MRLPRYLKTVRISGLAQLAIIYGVAKQQALKNQRKSW
ncbi:hypothetical protein PH505_bb00510 [Pseudoalteromonas distincta]|nr:hypothetical protein PH505_bb00510 [Pseudoalteromonas distincta]